MQFEIQMAATDGSTTLSVVTEVVQIAAWISAALFFGYKVISGYFVCNLSLKVECDRRQVAEDDQDYLAVTMTADKGERGTIELLDARVTVFEYSSGEKIHAAERCQGVRRLSDKPGADGFRESYRKKSRRKGPCSTWLPATRWSLRR